MGIRSVNIILIRLTLDSWPRIGFDLACQVYFCLKFSLQRSIDSRMFLENISNAQLSSSGPRKVLATLTDSCVYGMIISARRYGPRQTSVPSKEHHEFYSYTSSMSFLGVLVPSLQRPELNTKTARTIIDDTVPVPVDHKTSRAVTTIY